ncbi:MAG: hypothetical protein AABX29_09075 [Nanoarchaeota archaeon]
MAKYIRPIDPHVHLRGEEYQTNYLELGFGDARAVGLIGLLEQPNPKPQLTRIDKVMTRLHNAKRYSNGVYHGIHMGLTTDLNQVGHALSCVVSEEGIIADKTFYVHSTGDMGILDPELQRRIWIMKGKLNYTGVSIGHFEDESEFGLIRFYPHKPMTHTVRQTAKAELVQVQKQIRNAFDANFNGVFYVAHVSNPDTVDYIEAERKRLPFEVVLEVTFHHMFLNTDDYKIHGNRVKMNPPLRSPIMQGALLGRVLDGKLQIIGTDHAPHPYELKTGNTPPSGIPTLPFWPRGIQLLRDNGINESLLENMIFNNANRIFKLNLPKELVDIEYDESLWQVYGYNPFSRLC